MTRERMTIGDLAERSGTSVKTIRRYTDQGLVCSIGRSEGGYRLYDETALSCLRSVRVLRGLGLSLGDVQRLYAFYGDDGRPVGPWLLDRLADVRSDVERRMQALRCMRDAIDAFLERHEAALARGAVDDLARGLGEDAAPEAERCVGARREVGGRS